MMRNSLRGLYILCVGVMCLLVGADAEALEANAGPDIKAVVWKPFRLNGQVTNADKASWRIVQADRGRTWAVKLRKPGVASQNIHISRSGRYVLELAAIKGGKRVTDRTTITIVDSPAQLNVGSGSSSGPASGSSSSQDTGGSTSSGSFSGSSSGFSPAPSSGSSKGVPVILDTDLGGDVDDAGALAVLNEMHNKRQARMLAVMSVSWRRHSVAAISAINTFYGNGSVPIGRHSRGSNSTQETYAKYLASKYKTTQTYEKAPSSTTLYRKLLASQPDRSVAIVVIGQLRNIEQLLRSNPDGISSLNGRALVNKKVKSLHIMGGQYPKSKGNGEANFIQSGKGVAQYVVDNVTRPIIFNGFEIGNKGAGYRTGSKLNSISRNNPVAGAYHYFFRINPPGYVNGGRPMKSIPDWSIWDQIAIAYAIRPDNRHFGTVTKGFNKVERSGANVWRSSPDRNHTYLVKKMNPQTYADSVIEPLMIK